VTIRGPWQLITAATSNYFVAMKRIGLAEMAVIMLGIALPVTVVTTVAHFVR
jgi:HD-like signal output (HDOD) protein